MPNPALNSARLDLYWNEKQTQFLQSTEPFVDLEGGVRAGKSYALCWKVLFACLDYPGIVCALTRWTQDGLDAQLRPAWRHVCRMAGVATTWNPTEEYDELPGVGSRVYLRALKAAEDTNRFGKLAGLEFSIIGIDQAEEVPEDVYRAYVPARLSQRMAPDGLTPVVHREHGTAPARQVLITPNPPANEDHWICKDWPLEGAAAGHLLIHTSMFDNIGPLGAEYVEMQQTSYEEGSPEYRRFVRGERGVTTGGDPIFGGSFDEKTHVRTLKFNPALELIETIDFGTRRPCVTWQQYWAGGILVSLGGLMGQNMTLEEFVPIVEEYRSEWFPGLNLDRLRHTCDPAGSSKNAHGSDTGVQILRTFNINPLVKPAANHPPVKDAAIQKVNGYLLRRQADGSPCFMVDPRFVIVSKKGRKHQPVLVQALRSGYIYDPKRNYIGTAYPHIRPAFKDGFYEHPCDSFLYGVIAYAPKDPAREAGHLRTKDAVREAERLLARRGITLADLGGDTQKRAEAVVRARADVARERAESRALKESQKDRDPDDSPQRRVGRFAARRGGY